MARIAVVTDSTSGLPPEYVAAHDVRVVPLQVVLGGRVGLDGVDVSSADVAQALAAHLPVSTSRPSPAAFAAAYDSLAGLGYDEVVSVHLSSGLSGTCEAARVAAGSAAVPVHVVDSRSTAMGLGFAVRAAVEAASSPSVSAAAVVAAAESAVGRTRALFYVHSLDALRRGGRIGQAAALVGSALAVKPLLHVVDGRIALAERVRTTSRALARLEELAVEGIGSEPVDVAVHHLAAPERAEALMARLRPLVPGLAWSSLSEVGAVVGAHVGAGLVGVVVHTH